MTFFFRVDLEEEKKNRPWAITGACVTKISSEGPPDFRGEY